MKRGTEDLDFFIGDEALAAANGPGVYYVYHFKELSLTN
jgi:actin-related protein 3